jgi:hypothetical protein
MALPKFHDERSGHLPEDFFLALGHVQHAYTMLEVNLTCQISSLITFGYDPKEHRFLFDRIQAVLGGMRMDNIKDTLKRLLRVMAAPPELLDYVALIFAQLSEIQYFRNRLTHYQTGRWFRKRGPFINTDMGQARERDKIVTFRFEYDALEAARHDLHAIAYYMEQAIPNEDHGIILEPPAWQYKPSMLAR